MATEHSKQALRPTTGTMITIKIADEISRIRDSVGWKSADRHAISLVKDAALNVMLMMLKKGSQLGEHRTKGPITVQILSGSIRFSAGADQRVISTGEIVGLDRDVAHNLEALEESALILTTAIS